MLRVPTYVTNTDKRGLGLFSRDHIKKGQLVWELVPGFDVIMTTKQWSELSEWQQAIMGVHAYLDHTTNMWIYAVDDGKYFNHSYDPSCITMGPYQDMAARDISPEEELTINYEQFCTQPLEFVPF